MDFRKQQLLFFFLIVFGNLVAGRVLDRKSEDSETSNVDAVNGNVSELVSNETLSRDKIETTGIQLRDEKSTQTNSNVGTSNSPFCQVSISSTFYVQIFRTNVVFLVGFVEKFVCKNARITLMKLTTGGDKVQLNFKAT